MKAGKLAIAAAVAFAAATAGALDWRNLDDANWISGPKLTPESLEGKVVLVDEWGVNCPPCRALLPRIEQIWQSFRPKGLVVIGSHRQGNEGKRILELRAENKLTYPIYIGAGIVGEPSNGGGIPFMYVINSAGEVVYSGREERAATEAIVNELTDMPDPTSLIGSMIPVKFKSMAKDLVIGKNVENKIPTLKSAAKKTNAEGKEADAILKALDKSKERIAERIKKNLEKRPGAALTDITLYSRSWPSSAAEFAEDRKNLEAIPEVRKLQQVAASLAKVTSKPPRNSGGAKASLAALAPIEKQLDALAASENAAVKAEVASIQATVKSTKAEYESMMPKKK